MDWNIIVPVTLCGVVVFQQVYYIRVINKLVNKLMSRNYSEYKLATRKPVKRESKLKEPLFLSEHELSNIGPSL